MPLSDSAWLVAGPVPGTTGGTTFFVDDVEVAVFRIDDQWHAIEGRCPHRGASLGNGQITGNCVICPWHGWEFDITTGAAVGRTSAGVATLPVRERDGMLEVDLTPVQVRIPGSGPRRATNDGIQRCLVRYGTLGWVGLFGTVDGVDCRHRDRVVVRTHRGLELGEVLCDSSDRTLQVGDSQPTGELLRLAGNEELSAHSDRTAHLVTPVIHAAQKRLTENGINLTIVDAELLFDDESAVLYFLGESRPDAGPLVTDVAREHGLERIELTSLIEPPRGGCGSGGCGDGGCGTGGGGCGSE